ncbi:hypothetical protein D5Q94_20935 [Salmonella enterica subsp. diarizonae serovar 61:k:1,5,(7)]|uniref:Uncharacterized protein n=9 Tax=Salmonella enterica TaxID=28901 RepID=A0A447R6E2_SALER|nr:hypothetical protein [Salmonella enterica]ASG84143.1 hypothetical protein LFZ55_15075 [Salmonella enterica subsp. diarizonae serovar 65:c:z str. SA20044251]AXC71866.1 hypothetical protein DOE59_09930 [Salmonella enterica subsp. diarizonae serovar 48:i:z]EAA2981904.1 hypothetical protein [Salmonella enterica subsp. diarizonae]EAA3810684.1 hypothetical protein [Salmonella enterica subsp. enterica serovar Stanley]EAA6276355.1 hypothetical protein [Salmonella enterica subsp. enterica serovar Te
MVRTVSLMPEPLRNSFFHILLVRIVAVISLKRALTNTAVVLWLSGFYEGMLVHGFYLLKIATMDIIFG